MTLFLAILLIVGFKLSYWWTIAAIIMYVISFTRKNNELEIIIKNQGSIVDNQKTIVDNQETIVNNQRTIVENQTETLKKKA